MGVGIIVVSSLHDPVSHIDAALKLREWLARFVVYEFDTFARLMIFGGSIS